jgi:hypothetical protein
MAAGCWRRILTKAAYMILSLAPSGSSAENSQEAINRSVNESRVCAIAVSEL